MIGVEEKQLGIKWMLRYSSVEGLPRSHPGGLKQGI